MYKKSKIYISTLNWTTDIIWPFAYKNLIKNFANIAFTDNIYSDLHDELIRKIPWEHFDGLVQDCTDFTVNALELAQSCSKPSI